MSLPTRWAACSSISGKQFGLSETCQEPYTRWTVPGVCPCISNCCATMCFAWCLAVHSSRTAGHLRRKATWATHNLCSILNGTPFAHVLQPLAKHVYYILIPYLTNTHLLRNILLNYWCGMHRTCKNTSVKPDRNGLMIGSEKLCEEIFLRPCSKDLLVLMQLSQIAKTVQ